MNTVAEILLQVVNLLGGGTEIASKLAAESRERRDRVATLLEKIAICLRDIAKALSEEAAKAISTSDTSERWGGGNLFGRWERVSKCSELESYVIHLSELLAKWVKEHEVNRLLHHLISARVGPMSAVRILDGNPGFLIFKMNVAAVPDTREEDDYQRQMGETGISTFYGSIGDLRDDLRGRLVDEIDKISIASGKFQAAASMLRAKT